MPTRNNTVRGAANDRANGNSSFAYHIVYADPPWDYGSGCFAKEAA
jgi:hypothetical protein